MVDHAHPELRTGIGADTVVPVSQGTGYGIRANRVGMSATACRGGSGCVVRSRWMGTAAT